MKFELLSKGSNNHKIGKNDNQSYLIYSLNLRPNVTNVDGRDINVCPNATKGCISVCVGDNGHFQMRNGTAYKAQVRRTQLYFRDTAKFYRTLVSDIEKAFKQCANKSKKTGQKVIPVFRLNAYSDINHKKQSKRYLGKSIFDMFSDAIFYDYTKDRRKALTNDVPNYSVTYSHNEDQNIEDSLQLVRKGVNVAVVFEKLPQSFHGCEVIDGDINDNRFEDKRGVIVGLKFKGSKKELLSAISSGFCIPA